MPLSRLDLTDFRNILSARLEPLSGGFNFIYGENGSGKTSLLEAIYYLGLGRSFRSSNSRHIVRNSSDKFAIFSHVTHPHQSVSLGLERLRDGSLHVRLDGKSTNSISEVATLLPIQLINSSCHNLLDAGPQFRRKYLDWGAFYHSSDFLRVWRQCKRALKQRNAALVRRVSKKELSIWDEELAGSALILHQMREDYIRALLPVLCDMLLSLIELPDLKVEYYPGWESSLDYRDVLAKALDRDIQLGYTQFGPHKANMSVLIKGLPAKDILSRGQQKLFVCAMIVAQGALLFHSQNKRPIYLVDDLPSELDMTSRANLIALLSKQEAQIFVTAVERKIFEGCLMTKPVRLFHVEHGSLTQVGF